MAIDIVLFAVLAVFLYVRLRSVLGQKTEILRTPLAERILKDNDVVIDVKAKPIDPETVFEKYPEAVRRELISIQKADARFDDKSFLKGAQSAFEEILKAFSAHDRERLKFLLSDDVYQAFESEIASHEAKKETLETTVVAIRSAEIIDAELKNSEARVTVKIRSEQTNLLKNESGEILEGNAKQTEYVNDVWTFVRDVKSKNPNWKLVSTSGDDQ